MSSQSPAAVSGAVSKKRRRKHFFDDDYELSKYNEFDEASGDPEDIECTPTLIAVCALCLAVVTLAQSLIANARIEVLDQLNTCGNFGTRGWQGPNEVTPQEKINGMASNAIGDEYQFGTVYAPGLMNLGFKTTSDGFKEFTLIAQPVKQQVMAMNNYLYQSYQMSPWKNLDISAFASSESDSTANNINSVQSNYTAYLWGYNGQSPGPVIEAFLGDKIRIYFNNELPEPTTLHFDGMIRDWEDDALGGVTELPLEPGKQKTIVIKITQCGNFLYHSGYQSWKQDRLGLYGHLIVHCPSAEPTVDRDISLVVSALNVLGKLDKSSCRGWWRPEQDWFFFNGHSSPSIPIIRANDGETVRFRFINPHTESIHPVEVVGHSLTILGAGNTLLPQMLRRKIGSTVDLPAGIPKDVVFQARAGIWIVRSDVSVQTLNYLLPNSQNPKQITVPGGMFTYLCVQGQTPQNTTITCPSV